jgi:hypothetical protein
MVDWEGAFRMTRQVVGRRVEAKKIEEFLTAFVAVLVG